MSQLMDGKAVSARVVREARVRAERLRDRGVVPKLAVILVGDNPASAVYVRIKARRAKKARILDEIHRLPSDVSQQALHALITRLNGDASVHGILLQLPLPDHLDAYSAIDGIDPDKDVDGLHPTNIGRLVTQRPGLYPCTPRGVMRLLHEYDVPTRGRHAVVLGRSDIVGRPMGALLVHADATVTICHDMTGDSSRFARHGDILISAVGQPGLVTPDWVKPGAVVVDVGINRLADGTLTGDVDFPAVSEVASLITPVPGGVGPMTVAMLLDNTCLAAELAAG